MNLLQFLEDKEKSCTDVFYIRKRVDFFGKVHKYQSLWCGEDKLLFFLCDENHNFNYIGRNYDYENDRATYYYDIPAISENPNNFFVRYDNDHSITYVYFITIGNTLIIYDSYFQTD